MRSVLKDTPQRYKFLRNFRYVLRTRYAASGTICCFATSLWNLYHIAISERNYIEFAVRQIYRVGFANISTKTKNLSTGSVFPI